MFCFLRTINVFYIPWKKRLNANSLPSEISLFDPTSPSEIPETFCGGYGHFLEQHNSISFLDLFLYTDNFSSNLSETSEQIFVYPFRVRSMPPITICQDLWYWSTDMGTIRWQHNTVFPYSYFGGYGPRGLVECGQCHCRTPPPACHFFSHDPRSQGNILDDPSTKNSYTWHFKQYFK